MAFSFRAGTNWCHDFPKLARESGFHFNMHRRRVRVDWNRISSIDIDRVIGERDFSTIDENVNNVVDYCLESEYDVKILDPNFVKLFRLAQLAVEYLLYCKQYLDHSVVILKDELRSKLDENSILKDEQNSSEKLIKQLKDKLKERSKIIETKLSDSHGEIHKCPQCPKTFISGLFMNAHINRRHPHLSSTSPVHEQYKAETEKLHSEIKTLKERLNVTERVIRNESEKLLTSESIVSNDNRETRMSNKNDQQNRRDRDERIEEQHKRYQEEIDNLKTTIFDEIRNLKMSEKYPREKHENDDAKSDSVKEIIKEQENEIRRLRQELSTKEKPNIEEIEAKRENYESLWQSKIDYLETRHRGDIEKLYTQLRVTQESADQMRIDYMTRLSDLERREASLESTLIRARNISYENSLSPGLRDNVRTLTRKKIDETLIHPLNSIETQENRFFIREKERMNEKKSDYVNDEDLQDYQTDESSQNSEMLKIVDRKERSKEITSKSSSTPILSKNNHRTTKRDEVTPIIVNEERGKARKRWKVDCSDRTSLNEEIQENLRNGSEINPCSSNSYTPNEKERTKKFDSRENLKNKIFDRNNVAENSIIRRKIKEENSVIRDLVSDRDRKNHEIVVIRDSRKKLPVVEKRDEITIEESGTNRKNREKRESSESEESDSSLESESFDNSTGSQTEDNSEEGKNRRSNWPKRKIDLIEENLFDYKEKSNQDTIEIFNSKLRDLGIDPEWRGVPNATFAQIMEIVRHHRIINSKKYRKFDEIRRKLLHQLSRKFADKEKEGRNDDFHEKSSIGKLVTNVKSKVSKALNILDKNDGSHSTKNSTNLRREKVELRKLPEVRSSNISSMIEKDFRGSKLQYQRESVSSEGSDEKLTSRSEKTLIYERYGPIERRKQMENVFEPSTDIKHLSHSYESVKDFLKNKNVLIQQKSSHNVSGSVVTSTPKRNVEIPIDEVTTISNDAHIVRISKQQDNLSLLSNNSPRNNKSVLKSGTGGSTGSLVKKKVLFDLESEEKSPERQIERSMYSSLEPEMKDIEKKNTSESDFEISSSIYDEKDQPVEKPEESPQSGKIVLLKTSQSEKIAQISKQIEQQLSIARRKPVGAVEAMFMEKFSLGNEIKESPMRTPRLTAESRQEPKGRQAISTNLQNQSLRSSSLFQSNSEIKDTNLDMDIAELLEMD